MYLNLKQKIFIGIFLFLIALLIYGIAKESMSYRPDEIDLYKKYCAKNGDVLCEKFGREMW